MTDWPVPAGRSSGIELAVGHAADWHEPGLPKFATDQPHSYATREIITAPTATELGHDEHIAPWQALRNIARNMLADAALLSGCDAFEIRYRATPTAAGSARVQMFVTAMVRDWHPLVAQAAVISACNALPDGFGWSTPERDLGFGASSFDDLILELRRDEEITTPQWDYVPADFYYTINDDPGDGSGWSGFWRSLVRATEPITVSLLAQRTELNWNERNLLGSVTTDLAMLSQPRTDYDILNNPIYYPACMNAKAALESWQRRIERLHRPLLVRAAVRGEISAAVTVATALATAIGASNTASGSHPMYVEPPDTDADRRQAAFSFDFLEILPWGGHQIWTDNQAPLKLRRMPYLFGLNEAAGLMVLPVPDEQGVAGMPRSRRVGTLRESVSTDHTADDGIRLGQALHHGQLGSPVTLPLAAINRHALVVGAPGSGKTTTVLSMLIQLWRDHEVPFLVLESVKAEYRSLLGTSGLNDLQVITLGNEGVSPLRLNPLEPPLGVRCEVHQSAVMASLKMALPLFPPQPQILAKALSRAYDRAGWDDETTISDGIAPPTLRDLLTHYRTVFASIGYEGEAKNVGLAFQTRLESLLQGSRGKLLDTVASSDFEALFRKPVVIEMNDIQDADEKAVLAAFVLDRVRACAKSRGSTAGQLKHVTVIEEAHRLLAKASVGSGDAASGNQARADSVRAFCEAIAELRSLGEGFVLSSQSPSALADAAVANTGTRILHRMESSADRNVMLDDLDASSQVREAAARLRKGEAVARWPERDEPEMLQVVPDATVDSGRFVSNEHVANQMQDYRRQVARILPYQLCSPEVCTTGCQSKVRRFGNETAEDLGGKAREQWNSADSAGRDVLEPIAKLVVDYAERDVQRAYCGAVHLSIQGDAFRLRPGRDDRPALARVIRRVARDG